jgi:osmotically-inducible protein OsmY
MKKEMSKALARTGQALLAAGALGLPVAVVAQQSTTSVPVLGSQANQGASESLLPVTYVEQSPADVNVELAFLANPSLFPCSIEVRILGTGLELRGNVSDEGIRALAVHVAQEVSGLRVVDALTMQARPRPAVAAQTPEALQRQAMHVLGQTLTKKASGVQVDVWNKGQVLLKGSVTTYQEKLAASRCLQKVTGCSCVINQLSVVNPEVPAQAQAPVAHGVNDSQIIKPVVFVQQQAAEPAAPKTTDESAAKSQSVFTPKWRRWEEVQSKLAQAGVPTASAPVATPKSAQVDPKPRTGLWGYLTANKAQTKPEIQQTAVVKPEGFIVPTGAQQAVIVPEVKVAQPAKPAAPSLMPIETSKATLLTPTRIQQPVIEPIKNTITPQNPPAKPAEPYVTSGVMIFEGTSKVAQAKSVPTTAQTKLQQRIAGVCSKPAQDVEVTKLSEKTLLIRVKATDASEGEKLSDLIFRIPELAPYEVSLDIPVVR